MNRSVFPPEVLAELDNALADIGKITPWFDEDVSAWVFEHPDYPESASGETPEQTIEAYKNVLAQLIQQRLAGTLAPYVAQLIRGRGGARPGAGRPKGTIKRITRTVRLPVEAADWIRQDPDHRQKLIQWIESQARRA